MGGSNPLSTPVSTWSKLSNLVGFINYPVLQFTYMDSTPNTRQNWWIILVICCKTKELYQKSQQKLPAK